MFPRYFVIKNHQMLPHSPPHNQKPPTTPNFPSNFPLTPSGSQIKVKGFAEGMRQILLF